MDQGARAGPVTGRTGCAGPAPVHRHCVAAAAIAGSHVSSFR
jgi:hypothetical protein